MDDRSGDLSQPALGADDRAAFAPGILLDGRFVLGPVLGEGGSGRVYSAEDRTTGQRVAIKIIQGTEGAARYDDEVRAMQRLLRGSNIVEVLKYGRTEGALYLVYEYVEGPSLEAVLRARGPLDEASALAVALAIASALAIAHRADIVHRDIKPSNILIPRDAQGAPNFGMAKLADFGVAGLLSRASANSMSQTMAGQLFGTPIYMSPEQIRALPQTSAADVYGLGAVLYEMLYGQPPFVASSVGELMVSIISAPPVLPEEPSVSQGVRLFVERCLQKDPSARPADGGRLVTLLEDLRANVRAKTPSASFAIGAPMRTVNPALFTTGASFEEEGRPAGVARLLTSERAQAIAVCGLFGAAVSVLLLPISGEGIGNQAKPVAFALFSVGASAMAGVLLHAWIERRRPRLQSDVGRLLGRTTGATDLRRSVAIDLGELIAACREVDQRILAHTIGLMVDEYNRARRSPDRQDALMKAVTLLEKLTEKLSPWYVRHQKSISWAVSIVGSVAGIGKTVVSMRGGH